MVGCGRATAPTALAVTLCSHRRTAVFINCFAPMQLPQQLNQMMMRGTRRRRTGRALLRRPAWTVTNMVVMTVVVVVMAVVVVEGMLWAARRTTHRLLTRPALDLLLLEAVMALTADNRPLTASRLCGAVTHWAGVRSLYLLCLPGYALLVTNVCCTPPCLSLRPT